MGVVHIGVWRIIVIQEIYNQTIDDLAMRGYGRGTTSKKHIIEHKGESIKTSKWVVNDRTIHNLATRGYEEECTRSKKRIIRV